VNGSSSVRVSAAAGFESAVISFHAVVRVLLKDMSGGRGKLVDHTRVDRRPIGGDLDRRRAAGQRAGEERPRSRAVAALADQDVDDLTALSTVDNLSIDLSTN
jgi:hypothetical protein